MADLEARRGDTEKYDLTVSDNGTPVNLTGAAVWFTAKLRASDPDSKAVIAKTLGQGIAVTNASQGQARITLSPGDTASLSAPISLSYDVQVKQTDGTVTTVESGALLVTADVTRATT